jgi:hypothetical protein
MRDRETAIAREQPVPVRALSAGPGFSLDAFRKPVDEDDPRVLRERATDPEVSTRLLVHIVESDDMHSRIRRFVEMDRRSMPDIVREAKQAGAEDNGMLLDRSGQKALERDPALCQRMAERLLVPYVAEQLRTDVGQMRFWAQSLIDDRRSGTYPSYINGRPPAAVVDDAKQMRESYKLAVGVAVATLGANWWHNHERCADGGASRRTSATFNVCRLVCADILDEATNRKPGLIDRLRNWGNDDAARLRAVLPEIRERLQAFAENPSMATHYLPRIDDKQP